MGFLGGVTGAGHDDGRSPVRGKVLHVQDHIGADRATNQDRWAVPFPSGRFPARLCEVEEGDARPGVWRASVTRQIDRNASVPSR